MNGDRVHAADTIGVRRRIPARKRAGRRAEVAAFEAWQRRQATQQWPAPVRRSRRG